MTTLKMTRRGFIKSAAVAGGGLVLSFYLPTRDEAPEPEAGFSPNVWITIAKDNSVTITVARSEMGQGVWTSMAMIVAEELEADWPAVRVVQADAHPTKYGSQSTGGSWSVRGSWEKLRVAGATGRAMMIEAAAKTWNISPSRCRASKGTVLDGTGRKLTYGDLAATAATLPVPASAPLKDPSEFRLLGTSIPKLDTPIKTYGEAVYGIDVRLPGMVYSSILKCPVFGGTVASYDATKTKAVPGVLDVLRFDDGIAVVATNTWAAFQGREALSVKWNEGEWSNQSSAGVRRSFMEAVKTQGDVREQAGDAESAFRSAAKRLESVYEAPLVAHVTMEPMNCAADVRSDRCEIWVPSQNPQGAQKRAVDILGLSPEQVTVHVTLLGGGFGRRLSSDFVADAVRVSKATGKPVLNVWTREDDIQHDEFRPATYNYIRAGLDKDGMPVAWLHRIAGTDSRGLVTGGAKPSYSFPNFIVDAHIIRTGIPIGPWRSVGPSQNGWVMESFIDELAFAAGIDPLEYRRRLLSDAPRLKGALEYAARKAGWGTSLPKGVGRGIACVESFGSAAAHVVEASVDAKGSLKIHRVVTAVDCGPVVNPDTIAAQMEGAMAYSLSATIKDEITVNRGRVQQSNFDDYGIVQIDEMPKMETYLVPSTNPVGGIGEPGLPPFAPALCNAIFAATGIRIRKLPIRPGDLKKA